VITMQSSLADLLDAWHDFDLLIGTAAATLVGLMFVAALVLFRQSPAGLDLLAASQITLLLAGIRNAWDMMLWIVIRAPTPNVGDRGDAGSN
jgi:hypothetical protein